jgi:hypothetical protein
MYAWVVRKGNEMLLILLVLVLLSLGEAVSLRHQWARSAGSTRAPDRVVFVRQCGVQPSDTRLPIAGIYCDPSMENVALACRDTQAGYLCRAGMWLIVGK